MASVQPVQTALISPVSAPAPASTSSLSSATATAAAASQSGSPGSDVPTYKDEPPDNQPFDARIMRKALTVAGSSKLPPVVSGVITTDTIYLTPPAPRVACYFMFNPAEIDSEYTFDPNVQSALPAQYLNQASLTQMPLALNQTFSFNLLFDRTYEVWNGPASLPSGATSSGFGPPLLGGPYRFGVLWDVWAIERIMGIYGQAHGASVSTAPMTSIVSVKLGGVVPPNTSAILPGGDFTYGRDATGANPQDNTTGVGFSYINFYGYIIDYSVQYTRFDAAMTPTRCEMALTFQQTYSNPNNAAGGGNTPGGTFNYQASQAAQAAGTTGNNPAPPASSGGS